MLYSETELKQAQENRIRVQQDYCGSFYRNQDHICEGWEEGKLPPRELILGSLHTIYSWTVTHSSPRVNDD